MTTPGPTLVYDCPTCKHSFKRRTIGSGNTFGARVRSDGRMYAPMLPSTPPLVACPHCTAAIPIYSIEPVAQYRTYFPGSFFAGLNSEERDSKEAEEESRQKKLGEKYEDTPYYEQAVATNYFDYLEHNSIDHNTELDMRRHALWLVNDALFPETIPKRYKERFSLDDGIAKESPKGIRLDARHKSNLEALLANTTAFDEESRLLKAELLRELGEYEDARDALNGEFANKAVAEQMLRHVEWKKSAPFLLAAKDEQSDFEYAWDARRYSPETISVPFEELDPPLFKIKNRDWYVKVLSMLCHNWALIEENADSTATVYFFQDHAPRERPAIIDSLQFSEEIEAWGALKHNGFTLLKETPGPWMGAEPKGYFYDARPAAGKGIYSSGEYWKDDYYAEV